jgi:hypothetical protein
MSTTATICRVCEQVSIEGYPESTECENCGFWFHVGCAATDLEDSDDINEFTEEPEEEGDTDNMMDACVCPLCLGTHVLLEDARSIWGLVNGLELGGVKFLTREMCKPLVNLPNFGLDLHFIKGMDQEAAAMLSECNGSLNVGVEDETILSILGPRLSQDKAKDPEILWPPSLTDVAR